MGFIRIIKLYKIPLMCDTRVSKIHFLLQANRSALCAYPLLIYWFLGNLNLGSPAQYADAYCKCVNNLAIVAKFIRT